MTAWAAFAITSVGVLIASIAFIAAASGRLAYYRACGLYAIANALCLVSDLWAHERLVAPLNAATLVWTAFIWWKGGGGDGTKRRLRSLVRKFTPTRRTAPQLGGA